MERETKTISSSVRRRICDSWSIYQMLQLSSLDVVGVFLETRFFLQQKQHLHQVKFTLLEEII